MKPKIDPLEIRFNCEMLIDQNRYIGDDPVGHACYNAAEFEMGNDGPLICSKCVEMLKTQPDRITFPKIIWGARVQKKLFSMIQDKLKKKFDEVKDETKD